MGVTWVQSDKSVRDGFWIYTTPGKAGHSLNDGCPAKHNDKLSF